jgi:cell division protein YceG involved in septum cleavage
MMERPRSLKPWGDSPKHSGPTWRTAVGLLVLAAVLSLLLEGWWILSVPETLRATSRVVEVPAHKGVVEVAEILDDAGVIRSRVGFILLRWGSFRSLKAGEYQILQGTNRPRAQRGSGAARCCSTWWGSEGHAARARRAARTGTCAGRHQWVARDAVFLKTLTSADSVEGYLTPTPTSS